MEKTTLQISYILVTRPKLRRPRRSAQIIFIVVDAMVDAEVDVAVDAVADAKVTARSGETIRSMGIEMIMEMVFKRGEMIGCDISFVRSVDGMPPIIMYLMPLGSVILEILTCLLTMVIGICQVRLLVLKLEMEPLKEVERAINPNAVLIFLK